MILGNQVEWALHCMTVLARAPLGAGGAAGGGAAGGGAAGGGAAGGGVMVPAKVLAEFHGVPKEYLSKCMQMLSQAGLVITTLGPKGGYRLARPADQISFLEVVEAIEGKKKTFHCSEIRRNNPCLPKNSKQFSNVCEIAAVMYEADEAWRASLRARKISDIVRMVEKKLEPETAQKMGEWIFGKT